MRICLVVDANNQSWKSLANACALARHDPATRLILAGIDPRQGQWRRGWPEQAPATFIANPSVVEGGTAIRLTIEVVRQAVAGELNGYRVLVLSPERAYGPLLEFLSEQGVHAMRSSEMTTVTLNEVTDNGLILEGLRRIYQEISRKSGPRVHVGNFADMAVQRFPELLDPANRYELFGTKRFGRIANVAGLKTDTYFIVAS
jgi:hypothetical protein